MESNDTQIPVLALRPRDACKALGVSQRTLWTWTRRGLVPYIRVGRCVLYPTSALQDWLSQQATAGQPLDAEVRGDDTR